MQAQSSELESLFPDIGRWLTYGLSFIYLHITVEGTSYERTVLPTPADELLVL
jgi:hypothetical protein